MGSSNMTIAWRKSISCLTGASLLAGLIYYEYYYIAAEKYFFHSSCECYRYAAKLQERIIPSFLPQFSQNSSLSSLSDGSYVGLSSCNQYTSQLGSGQKVLTYSYFTP